MELHHKPDQACLMLPVFPGSPVFYDSLDLEASDALLAVKNPLIHDNKGKVVMSWVISLFSRIIISSNSLCRESQSSPSLPLLCTNLLKELGLGIISNSPYLLIYNNLDSFSHLVGILVVTSLPAW